MNPREMSRTERRSFGIRIPLTHQHQVRPVAVRIPNLRRRNAKAVYEVRLSNKTERSFHGWDDLVTFMRFPPERGPELFTVCFEHRGEWIEFSDDPIEYDDETMNTPILYECDVCGTCETRTPLQSVQTTCKCGGAWKLVDISEVMESLPPLPSQREDAKTSYDF